LISDFQDCFRVPDHPPRTGLMRYTIGKESDRRDRDRPDYGNEKPMRPCSRTWDQNFEPLAEIRMVNGYALKARGREN